MYVFLLLLILRFFTTGASAQSSKVSLPTNSVPPADAANQQNAFSHSSNLMNLLRGSQENSSQSKIDVRTLGEVFLKVKKCDVVNFNLTKNAVNGFAEATGKLHSLEEIEAKWRGADKNLPASVNSTSGVDRKKKEEESEAFKKLVTFILVCVPNLIFFLTFHFVLLFIYFSYPKL